MASVDKPSVEKLGSRPTRKRPGRIGCLRRDEGWNFMEATLSVALLTVVFLGFTITLIAMREWMMRAWAIRVMDQYANDVASFFQGRHPTDQNRSVNGIPDWHRIGGSSSQYGLGAFWTSVVNYDFTNPYHPFIDSTVYHFSARPSSGIYYSINNTGAIAVDPDFPPPGWNNKHKFTFTEFGWEGPYQDPLSQRSFQFEYSLVNIHFSIHYQRPRYVEVPGSIALRNYDFEKRYVISGFMKNYNVPIDFQ